MMFAMRLPPVPARRRSHRLAALAGVAALGLLAGPPAAARADVVPGYHPSRLTHVGDARQVVVVTSSSWSTSYATLRTYELTDDGAWRAVFAPMGARIGARGFAPAVSRRQNTSTTPAGTFPLPRAFGSWGAPGTRMPYYQIDKDDWWPYDPRDPATYNVFQYGRLAGAAWRPAWAERLRAYAPRQYGYAVVIGFNLPGGVGYSPAARQHVATTPADTRAGGGIFLHVKGPGATAGCVALDFAALQRVLRWLDPAASPVVVMGPEAVIGLE